VKRVNLAMKATVDEARLLRRVGALFVGGFSAWARALLLRAAVEEARRSKIATSVDSSVPVPRRRDDSE
jgi:hypothetical protein